MAAESSIGGGLEATTSATGGVVHHRTTDAEDGYAARENLAHPLFAALATDRQAQECRALVRACALGAGTVPDKLRARMTAALRASGSVIRET